MLQKGAKWVVSNKFRLSLSLSFVFWALGNMQIFGKYQVERRNFVKCLRAVGFLSLVVL